MGESIDQQARTPAEPSGPGELHALHRRSLSRTGAGIRDLERGERHPLLALGPERRGLHGPAQGHLSGDQVLGPLGNRRLRGPGQRRLSLCRGCLRRRRQGLLRRHGRPSLQLLGPAGLLVGRFERALAGRLGSAAVIQRTSQRVHVSRLPRGTQLHGGRGRRQADLVHRVRLVVIGRGRELHRRRRHSGQVPDPGLPDGATRTHTCR